MHFSALHQSTLVLVLSSLSTTFANPLPQDFDLEAFGDEFYPGPSDLAFADVGYEPTDDAGSNLFDEGLYQPLSSDIIAESDAFEIAQGEAEVDCVEWEQSATTSQQESPGQYKKDPLPGYRGNNGGGGGGGGGKKLSTIKLPKPEEAQKVAPEVVRLATPNCGNKKAACKFGSSSGLTYSWIPCKLTLLISIVNVDHFVLGETI